MKPTQISSFSSAVKGDLSGGRAALGLPLEMCSAPEPNGLDERPHRFPVRRDLVLDMRRRFGKFGSTDESFVLQIAQRRRQDFVRNVRHQPAKFVEPAGSG